MNGLEGKVAVITGGGQGIGLGISQTLLAAGAEILVAQRNPLPTALANQKNVKLIEADLSQADSYALIANAAKQIHGKIDILINNAGFMFEKTIDDM